jgi:predicted nucleic acid-binding protein
MANYLLDTNHASPMMALAEPLLTRIQQAQAQGHDFGISMTVLGELYHAVYSSQRRAEICAT